MKGGEVMKIVRVVNEYFFGDDPVTFEDVFWMYILPSLWIVMTIITLNGEKFV